MTAQIAAPLLINDEMCFGCGVLNPIGLKLVFAWEGDTYRTHWTPAREHQGWAGIVHGGMIALTLDETLSRAGLSRYGLDWVTAELTTRLICPARVGIPLVISASIENARRAIIHCRGEVCEEQSGLLVASGAAKLMRAKGQATDDK